MDSYLFTYSVLTFSLYIRLILEKEGPRSLFRGLGPNLVGVAPSRYDPYAKHKCYRVQQCPPTFSVAESIFVIYCSHRDFKMATNQHCKLGFGAKNIRLKKNQAKRLVEDCLLNRFNAGKSPFLWSISNDNSEKYIYLKFIAKDAYRIQYFESVERLLFQVLKSEIQNKQKAKQKLDSYMQSWIL